MLDLVAAAATDEASALAALRAMSCGYLPLGPLCLLLLLELRPDLAPRYRGMLRSACVASPVLALAILTTPWFVTGAHETAWGWTPEYGPGFAVALLAAVGYPAAVFAATLRHPVAADPASDRTGGMVMPLALGLPLAIVVTTDVLFPFLEIDGPRLGTLAIALVTGTLWLRSVHHGHISPAAGTTARELFDRLSHGVALLSRDGSFRAVNASLAALLGSKSDEAHRLDLGELLPDSLQALWSELDEHETMLRISGEEMIPVSISSRVIRDRRGSALGLVLTVKDQRQVVELRRRLVTSGRLAAVGELAAGIAHEVNNPVAFIQANLNLLSEDLERLEEELAKDESEPGQDVDCAGGRDLIQRGLSEIGRVASTVREVVDFAHVGSGAPGPQDVNRLLDRAVDLAALQGGARLSVERRYAELPPVQGNEQDLKHVFVNLLLNATRHARDASALRLVTELGDGEVRVRVEEEGWAVAPGFAERRFDPALDAAHGLGSTELGLSLSYQIMRRLGGNLTLDVEGEGAARVTAHLPLAPDPEGEADATSEGEVE